jgi:hypothetical protein
MNKYKMLQHFMFVINTTDTKNAALILLELDSS